MRSVPNVDIALRQRKHWPNIMLKSQICFKITSYFCRSKEGSIVLKIKKKMLQISVIHAFKLRSCVLERVDKEGEVEERGTM